MTQPASSMRLASRQLFRSLSRLDDAGDAFQQPRLQTRGPRTRPELLDEHHAVADGIDGEHRRDPAAFEDLAREHGSDAARELPVAQAVAVETKVAVVNDLPAHQLDIVAAHPTSSAVRLAKLPRTAHACAPHCTVTQELSVRPGRHTEISGSRPARNFPHARERAPMLSGQVQATNRSRYIPIPSARLHRPPDYTVRPTTSSTAMTSRSRSLPTTKAGPCANRRFTPPAESSPASTISHRGSAPGCSSRAATPSTPRWRRASRSAPWSRG